MSRWYAVDALDESLDRTIKLLFNPVKLGFWLKLALVVLLANSLGGGNGSRVVDSTREGGGLDPAVMAVAVAAFAAILFMGLVLMYLSSVSRFVFIKSLAREDVRLIEDFRGQAGNGLKLFLLQIAVFIVFILPAVAGVLVLVFVAKTLNTLLIPLALGIAALILFAVAAVVLAIAMWFVMEFVVPIMYASGCGVAVGLRRLWDLVKANPWQFTVYTLLKFALGLAAAVLVFVVSFFFFAAVFFVALFLGAGAYLGLTALGGLSPGPGMILFIVVGVVAYMAVVVVVSYVITVITLPLYVFLRFYGLIFLGRIDPKLNLFKPGEKDNEPAGVGEDEIKVY